MRSRPMYPTVEKRPNSAQYVFLSQCVMPDAMQSIYDDCDQGKRQYWMESDADVLATQLRLKLPELPLATTFYLAGSEPFLWSIAGHLEEQGVIKDQILMFTPTSTARNVFCCHCYTVTKNVTESPVKCAGCQKLQSVTDHFSRLHGAYRGCQVNAENPADLPETMELS